jgi:membrane-associated protein
MDLMSWFLKFMDIVLHLDLYLGVIITQYGLWTYLFLFLVVFVETGLVFTPFLPGDSLLFTAGTMAGMGLFNIWVLIIILSIAAILGDTVNYFVGKFVGAKILRKNRTITIFGKKLTLINTKHVDETKNFFNKYGSETIIIARLIPIVRTFAPFLAGIGNMNYWKFLVYNVVGGILWVSVFVFGGYFFGGLKFVQDNFSLVLIGIILVSFIPVFIHIFRAYKYDKKK